MPLVDHLGISVADVAATADRFEPVLTELGYVRADAGTTVFWTRPGETELIFYPARDPGSGPHEHGRVGWQHLAFAVGSRAEVDRLHAVAVASGWGAVRDPKRYPRFTPRYYASFLEDENGIRIEFMHNPPREAKD